MEDIKMIFSKNLIALRKSVSYTQAELASKLNYSDKSVSKWERGESIPDVTILKQMATFFGVTIDYLVSEHKENEEITLNISETNDNKLAKRNHILITFISIVGIYLVATLLFIIFNKKGFTDNALWSNWYVFISALPLSFLVAFILCCIWGFKLQRAILISAMCWSTLLLAFLITKIWLLFVIGAPAQIIILLTYGIKLNPLKKKDSK